MDVSLSMWTTTLVVLLGVLAWISSSWPGSHTSRRFERRPCGCCFYVGLTVAFGIGLSVVAGGRMGGEFFAGWLTEYSLSVDNLFEFIIIMGKFAVPRKYQQKVLLIGVALALAMRGIFCRARCPGDLAVRLGVLHLRCVPDLHRLEAGHLRRGG